MARVAYLQTTNLDKLAEYKQILGRHRIQVLKADPDATLETLFASRRGVFAVLQEESDLYDPSAEKSENALQDGIIENANIALHQTPWTENSEPIKREDLNPLQVAENRTVLRAVTKNKEGALLVRTYHASIEGFISLGSDAADGEEVFGWDDRFATKGTQMTYQEMRRRGLKLSARDRVLAQFTQNHLVFPSRRDLKATPQSPERTIDFSRRMKDFVDDNPYLNHEKMYLYGASNSLAKAINQGAFWRAASHPREGIYWNPSGNGGVPYTPKIHKQTKEPDQIHETEFFVHDMGHYWMCPDLIFEGDTDPLSLRVQITWRMMSESLTLVNGSMLYMDALKKSGTEYDYSRRKIYPLFESLKGDFEGDPRALRRLFYANVRYALRNDDSLFKEMGTDEQSLESYERKYHAYFVEDYKWTLQNVENMTEDADKFKRWRKSVEPLKKHDKYLDGVMTVSQCIQALSDFSGKDRQSLEQLDQDKLIELMFNHVWESNIESTLCGEPIEVDDDLGLKSGFLRYMMAQLYIFDVFDFVPESKEYQGRIIAYLQEHMHTLTQQNVNIVREHYSQFVDILFERDAITEEDRLMYKEIFPHFPPHYIYYDRSVDSYDPLNEVSERVWHAVSL